MSIRSQCILNQRWTRQIKQVTYNQQAIGKRILLTIVINIKRTIYCMAVATHQYKTGKQDKLNMAVERVHDCTCGYKNFVGMPNNKRDATMSDQKHLLLFYRTDC